MEFTVVRGDIAEASADALVNAAGTSLRMGSGVAGALRRGANGPINEAAMEQGPVDLGGVAVTDAFDLDAEVVVHAAAMPHYGDGRATAESIRDATRNALSAADERGCTSLVTPALGCGVAGFDLAEGARIIAEAIREYDPETLRDVRFIAYSTGEYETVSRVADAVRGEDGDGDEDGE
ncbi:O-acetyl-ADP-ribose deacetylase (regulator of RNase III), contains Macro domain [Halorubrum aquaticum]|uniref:O-acetyl-ADP-ribose deacetylase (Regulator of RNase III), contains Macro domain n=1 Tax=Halorubrum aquaticum TaxID=387340 RepID=A0A1I3AXA7_9EURY|nr:macro domain-containing protein [Halorubrum aquaticum]SFH54717.1 O-acetyl-ADP-ribose deacetylase (regulator of RNase III), contains Macro domain [Halorubrum aquaticum]